MPKSCANLKKEQRDNEDARHMNVQLPSKTALKIMTQLNLKAIYQLVYSPLFAVNLTKSLKFFYQLITDVLQWRTSRRLGTDQQHQMVPKF